MEYNEFGVCTKFGSCLSTDCPNGNSHCLKWRDCREEIICEENKMKYKLKNDNASELTKYHVDGQLISGESKKCDYMLINLKSDAYKVIFVELKGKDVQAAIEQIDSTYKLLKSHLQGLSKVKFYGRIVLSRFSSNARTSSSDLKFARMFNEINREKNKKYGVIKSKLLEEKTSDL